MIKITTVDKVTDDTHYTLLSTLYNNYMIAKTQQEKDEAFARFQCGYRISEECNKRLRQIIGNLNHVEEGQKNVE